MSKEHGRAMRAGDAYEIDKKLEKRFEQEEQLGTPQRIVAWINKILTAEGEPPCPGHMPDQLHAYLKDGVRLCKLINKIAGAKVASFNKKASNQFMAMTNIENFNQAAKAWGLAEEALFQSVDLYEGRKGPMLNVYNCLNALGFAANKKGFQPQFEPIAAPKMWDEENYE